MDKVEFTAPAEDDLSDIEYYIYYELCNPQAAQRIVDGIFNASVGLGEYPMRYPIIKDYYFNKIELRMAHFENYNIFYYSDYTDDKVYIIRILYNRADWQNILK